MRFSEFDRCCSSRFVGTRLERISNDHARVSGSMALFYFFRFELRKMRMPPLMSTMNTPSTRQSSVDRAAWVVGMIS